MNKLKYIDAGLKETLRLQPTAPLIALESKEEQMTLPGGYLVHKGDTLLVLLALLHRDPKVWERAEEFLPERMLDGSFGNLPPNAWKPFGNGHWSSFLLAGESLGHCLDSQTLQCGIGRSLVRSPNPTDSDDQTRSFENQSSSSASCESLAGTLVFGAPLYGFNASVATFDWTIGALTADRPVILITASSRAIRVRCWASGLGGNLSEDSELHRSKSVEWWGNTADRKRGR